MSQSGAWVSLISEDQVGRVVNGFHVAIAASFAQDNARMTRSEVRRRFDICASLFGQLRRDMGWSIARILDHMPKLLRSELDGVPWTPDTRGVWQTE